MKLARKIISVQQPPNELSSRAYIRTKLDDVACRSALQHLFQLPQQDAEFFGVNLVRNDGIFGEEVVGDHY